MIDPHMLPPSEDEKETETELKTSLDGTPPKRMVDAECESHCHQQNQQLG